MLFSISTLSLSLCVILSAFGSAIPLHPRTNSPITCSNSTATTNLGSDIDLTQQLLNEINPFDAVNDSAPIYKAQLALLNASAISDQLGSLALFPTLSPDSPPPTALDDLVHFLAEASTQVNAIVVGPPGLKTIIANNTIALQGATKFMARAVEQANNIGCTVAGGS